MARKQKILSESTANLTRMKQEAKLKAEFLASDGLPPLQATPPNHLGPVAKSEYKRIVENLGNLPLRNLDRTELELYCTWYEVYKKSSKELEEPLDEKSYLSHVSTLNKATVAIKSLSSDLGLTVNSRMQMNMPKVEEKKESLKDRFT